MAKPSKQQVAEARKRGIVPGARIKCAAFGEGVVKAYSKWCSEARGLNDHSLWLLLDGKWASVITHAPSKPTQPRIKGRFAAKPKEQPDRIKQIELDVNRHGVHLTSAILGIQRKLDGDVEEIKAKLSRIESSVAVIRSGASFMQQLERDAPSMRELIQAELRPIAERLDALRMEQYALAQDAAIDPLMNNGIVEPQPASLQPGDYCDASKEVADELTAMGWKWMWGQRHEYAFVTKCTNNDDMINLMTPGTTHLDAPTFLSRARVTAKELGLKPVEAPAPQVDELQPGDRATVNREQWRELVDLAKPKLTYLSGNSYSDERTIGYHEGLLKLDSPGADNLPFPEFRRRLFGTIARRKEAERAEKVAKLGFGVRVRTAHGLGIYQMEDEHGAHVVVHPDTTGYHEIDQITII
jgi:hypothetical protein